MKRIIQSTLSLTVVLLALLLSSCDHKELCYEHPHKVTLRLVFDWKEAPDATPEGMHVCLYSADGDGRDYIFNFDSNGGMIEGIEAGRYHLLCYNNTAGVQAGNTQSFDTHELFTRDGNILEPVLGPGSASIAGIAGGTAERVVVCPDRMWGCTATDITVDELGVSYIHTTTPDFPSDSHASSQEHVVTLYPHELTCTYTYEIRNVSNLKYATAMCASLSGMAGSLCVADESLGRETVTLPFEAGSGGKSTITGMFHTFGHHEENTAPHRMALYVWMDDGRKYVYGLSGDSRFDVTGQVHSAPDRRRVHIIIDGLDLPTPIENGSGFNPDVDDWEVVEEEITM